MSFPVEQRQLKVKRRAGSRVAFCPDFSSHSLHCFLNHGKSDTGSRVVLHPVEPVEYFKNLVVELHIETDPIVFHGEHTTALR